MPHRKNECATMQLNATTRYMNSMNRRSSASKMTDSTATTAKKTSSSSAAATPTAKETANTPSKTPTKTKIALTKLKKANIHEKISTRSQTSKSSLSSISLFHAIAIPLLAIGIGMVYVYPSHHSLSTFIRNSLLPLVSTSFSPSIVSIGDPAFVRYVFHCEYLLASQYKSLHDSHLSDNNIHYGGD
jgi:hypothetical protein